MVEVSIPPSQVDRMTAAPLRVRLHLPPLKFILLPSTLRESKQGNIPKIYSRHPRGIGLDLFKE